MGVGGNGGWRFEVGVWLVLAASLAFAATPGLGWVGIALGVMTFLAINLCWFLAEILGAHPASWKVFCSVNLAILVLAVIFGLLGPGWRR